MDDSNNDISNKDDSNNDNSNNYVGNNYYTHGLIRQLNSEVTWASTVEIKNMVFTTPYPRFKTSIKNTIIDSYKEHCVKRTEDCFVCTRLRLF